MQVIKCLFGIISVAVFTFDLRDNVKSDKKCFHQVCRLVMMLESGYVPGPVWYCSVHVNVWTCI